MIHAGTDVSSSRCRTRHDATIVLRSDVGSNGLEALGTALAQYFLPRQRPVNVEGRLDGNPGFLHRSKEGRGLERVRRALDILDRFHALDECLDGQARDKVDIEVSKAPDAGEFLRGLVAFFCRGGIAGKACLPGFGQLAPDPVCLAAGNSLGIGVQADPDRAPRFNAPIAARDPSSQLVTAATLEDRHMFSPSLCSKVCSSMCS